MIISRASIQVRKFSYSYDALCMVAAFHHFSCADALRILSGAAQNNKPVFILEPITGRFKDSRALGMHYAANFFKNPFTSKENKLSKIIFSYLIPILPLVFMWDACISKARVYSGEEFYQMTDGLKKYTWGHLSVPVARKGKVSVYYGIPRQKP